MFTGIIAEKGWIIMSEPGNPQLWIGMEKTSHKELAIGESIAVSGVCLTVTSASVWKKGRWGKGGLSMFTADVSEETRRCTAARLWQQGASVNLERALAVGDRMGGHYVSGHVDGLATLISIEPAGESHVLTLEAPENLARYIAAKGSVTLDGVSLTVNTVEKRRFSVNIIPHTWQETTLGERSAGDVLNLEIDLIARYLERLTNPV
jgi:riboflavin synthase